MNRKSSWRDMCATEGCVCKHLGKKHPFLRPTSYILSLFLCFLVVFFVVSLLVVLLFLYSYILRFLAHVSLFCILLYFLLSLFLCVLLVFFGVSSLVIFLFFFYSSFPLGPVSLFVLAVSCLVRVPLLFRAVLWDDLGLFFSIAFLSVFLNFGVSVS